MKKMFLFLIALTILTVTVDAADSTLVRLRVDFDNVQLRIDSVEIQVDAYGNPLLKDTWFIISRTPGTYFMQLFQTETLLIDTIFIITSEDVVTFDYIFTPPVILLPIDSSLLVTLTITSEPDSAEIYIDRKGTVYRTPFTIWRQPDSIFIEADLDGYESLSSNLRLPINYEIAANFIFRPEPPKSQQPEAFGLTMLEPLSERKMIEVKKIKEKYNSYAQTFIVFPFAQGVVAELIVDDQHRKEADILLFSGTALVLGSFIFGKIFSSKRKKEIIAFNEMVPMRNEEIIMENFDIMEQVAHKNKELVDSWRKENLNKGKVDITMNETRPAADSTQTEIIEN